jgi:flagellar motor component MotA
MPAKTNKIVSQMIEDLVNIGQDTEEVTRYGKTWGFKLISSEEYLDALKKSSGADYRDEITRMYKMQIEILEKALMTIDGQEVGEAEKEILFNGVNPTIVNSLYQEFEVIRQKKDEELKSLDKKPTKKETASKNASIDA